MPPTNNAGLNNSVLLKLITAIFAIVFLSTAVEHTRSILNFNHFHEEHRNLYHFDTTWTNHNDYIAEFLSSAQHPILYEAITHAAVSSGLDLVLYHKILMLICAVLLLSGAAIAGYRAGGTTTAWLTMFLVAAQPLYFYQTNSATPHAFAFPLLMWGCVCLLYGRLYSLALLTILASLLYAPASIMLGLCLAWAVLSAVVATKPDRNSLLKMTVALVLTGAIAVAALLAQLAPLEDYGARIGPNEMTNIYPENGLNGRLHISATQPLTYIYELAYTQFRQPLVLQSVWLLMLIYVLFSGYGIHLLTKKSNLHRGIVAFAIPNALFFILIYIFRPYISYRFLLYPLFTLLPFCFVTGILSFSGRVLHKPANQILLVFVSITIYLFALDSRNAERNGFLLQLDETGRELMDFLGELPETTILAAWPYELQTGLIPYAGKRTLFITGKAHYTTYENHIIEMRQRTIDLIRAYLATETGPLVHLRCRWNVEFLVVDTKHFTSRGKNPQYFAPFTDAINDIFSKTKKEDMYLSRPPENEIIFRAGEFYVFDLSNFSNCTDQKS